MKFGQGIRKAGLAILAAMAVLAVGCATKKWVRENAVVPVNARIDTVDKKVDQNKQETDAKIDNEVAGLKDSIAGVQTSADKANQAAGNATTQAQAANQLAEKAANDAKANSARIDNLGNYQAVKSGTVLFKTNRSELTPTDKEALDALLAGVSSIANYAIAVRGHTDNSGSERNNLTLSDRRANAVMRYLTAEKNIPLVKVDCAGYGEANPVAPNNTREGRKQNRRADVTILAPQPGQEKVADSPGE